MAADLGVLADELYALPAEDFIAERDRQAKQLRAEGERDLAGQVTGLAKPTVAAWLLNQLARRRTTELEELLALGAELREAQQSLDGEQMRALNRQRQQVVRAFSRQVGELADELGRPMSGPVSEQVDETLRAAVADEEAGQALLSGRLTTALSYVGMGEGSVSSAVAVPRAPSAKDRRAGGPKSRGKAKGTGKAAGTRRPRGAQKQAGQNDADDADDVDELAAAREHRRQAAADELDTRRQEADAAAEALTTADREVADLTGRAEQLRERLEELRSELAEVDHELAETQESRDAADHHAQAAQEAAEAARRALDDLQGS